MVEQTRHYTHRASYTSQKHTVLTYFLYVKYQEDTIIPGVYRGEHGKYRTHKWVCSIIV